MAADRGSARLLGVLVQLREALVAVPLPLDTADVDAARRTRRELIDQLEDYVLPRLIEIDAPLLTVVGGSTGAGKSTLVNSLIRQRVSEPGVLRPTTRSPVLVHNPSDAHWFEQSRILPDLPRTTGSTGGTRALQLAATDRLPSGLAILDAPDIDSVEQRNRELATQLLAAADLWLFVTSAARYADQVPWDFLRSAVERSAAVAIVLDRTSPTSMREVGSHLAAMLASRGLGESPLFTVPEAAVDPDGLLPPAAVAPIREWLHGLAADASARNAVVRQTLDGAIRSLGPRTQVVTTAAHGQNEALSELRRSAEGAYAAAADAIGAATQDGTLLRGEVLARWQEFVGTGELLRTLEERIGRVRDRLIDMVKGRPQTAQRLTVAVESGLETLLLEHAEEAAEQTDAAWRATPAGRQLLARAPGDLGRASREFRGSAERTIRDWQQGVLDLVRREGADRRSRARLLAYGVNGLGVALMIVVFASSYGLTGAEVGIAGGSAALGQKLLEAVFGDQAVRRLAEQARVDLQQRVEGLLGQERARYERVLADVDLPTGAAARLRDLARDVEDARLEGAAR
ncbi:MAG: dynamin family protein [Actinomycetota bacterium]|nr:dynamin family protein [Actinomycetota bacterium]